MISCWGRSGKTPSNLCTMRSRKWRSSMRLSWGTSQHEAERGSSSSSNNRISTKISISSLRSRKLRKRRGCPSIKSRFRTQKRTWTSRAKTITSSSQTTYKSGITKSRNKRRRIRMSGHHLLHPRNVKRARQRRRPRWTKGKDVVPTTQETEGKDLENPPHWEGIMISPGKRALRTRKRRRSERAKSNPFHVTVPLMIS